ncbi:MAG: hypothetical protein K2Z25_18040 [Beijerinckiaceae bacterium]|nr:hypothetical protein [Beijerinckiaceae bacterium]
MIANYEPELLRRVYQFRYQIYVKEFGFDHPDAHHASGEIYDELDNFSTTYALIDENRRISATLRCSILVDLPNSTSQLEKFSMKPFVERFGIDAIGTTSRFMFAPDKRRSVEIFKLISASIKLASSRGVRFNFGDTNTIWLNYFERLGYRRYDEPLNDPVFGYHLPIVMIIRDLQYLRKANSPLMRYLRPEDDDAEGRHWFSERFGHFGPLSPLTRAPEEIEVALKIAKVEVSALLKSTFGSLPNSLQKEILEISSIVEAKKGDALTRIDEVDDTMFVCLSGFFIQIADGVPPKVFKPGSCFAVDEFLSGERRRTRFVAGVDSAFLVMPSRHVRRWLLRYGETFEAWLNYGPSAVDG